MTGYEAYKQGLITFTQLAKVSVGATDLQEVIGQNIADKAQSGYYQDLRAQIEHPTIVVASIPPPVISTTPLSVPSAQSVIKRPVGSTAIPIQSQASMGMVSTGAFIIVGLVAIMFLSPRRRM